MAIAYGSTFRLIDLEIPTLPKGKQLVINIKNTWGDRHYVGLNGIEVFTDTGKPAEIAEVTNNAHYTDV